MKEMILFQLRKLNNSIIRTLPKPANTHESMKETKVRAMAVHFLAEKPDHSASQSEFEKFMGMRRSTASRMLKSMEEQGVIVRTQDPRDARQKQIVLTTVALDRFNHVKTVFNNYEANLTKGISKEDLEIFCRTLETMRKNLKELEGEDS